MNQFNKWQYTDSECIESINNSIINGWTGIFELKQRHKEEINFKEIDTDNLTEEEYMKIIKGEKHA